MSNGIAEVTEEDCYSASSQDDNELYGIAYDEYGQPFTSGGAGTSNLVLSSDEPIGASPDIHEKYIVGSFEMQNNYFHHRSSSNISI